MVQESENQSPPYPKRCKHSGCSYRARGKSVFCKFHRPEDVPPTRCTRNKCQSYSKPSFVLCEKHLQDNMRQRERNLLHMKAKRLGITFNFHRPKTLRHNFIPCYWCPTYYDYTTGVCPQCNTPYDEEKTKKRQASMNMSYIDIVRKNEGRAGVIKVRKMQNSLALEGGTKGINKKLDAFSRRMAKKGLASEEAIEADL